MKKLLGVSLLLNAGLVTVLVLLIAYRSRTESQAVAQGTDSPRPSAAAGRAPGDAVPAQTAEKPFHWSRLESTDYRVYAANLRSIGCPEQTIADIITADVKALYARRSRELEERRVQAGGDERAELESDLLALRREETSLLSWLLAPAPASRDDSAGPVASALSRSRSFERPAAAARMPLVFQTADPASLAFNTAQLEAMANLRDRFIVGVGGPNQDPADPGYRQRWLKTQPEMDDLLRGFIGLRAYQAYELSVRSSQLDQQK